MEIKHQVDLILYNCKVYFKNRLLDAGIAVDNGKIAKIAKKVNLPKASKKINLRGHLVLPGLIDVHVHLRDQNLAYKETFYSGTAAAAAGGITSVIDMPNNQPVTMSAATLKERMKIAEKQTLVNLAFYSALPGKMEEISSIVKAGAVAFKIFMHKHLGGINVKDEGKLLQAFSILGRLHIPIAVHAEDAEELEKAERRLKDEGRKDINAYLMAHSAKAEVKAIAYIIKFLSKVKASIHVSHLSSKDGLNMILSAKKAGLNVTCEATPHHLFLSASYLKEKGALFLTDPPLRAEEDVKALWNGIRGGLIDVLASDHAPHGLNEKVTDNIWIANPGIPGLETMLPLMLTQVNKGAITIKDIVSLMVEKPAEIFSLDYRGGLKEGNFADLTVIDLHREHTINSSKFYSKAKFSPFDGWRVKGKPSKTFVNGILIMDDGEIVAKPGTGQILFKKLNYIP